MRTTRVAVWWSCVVVASLSFKPQPGVLHGPEIVPGGPCALHVRASQPLQLLDGRYLTLDAQSLATNGTALIGMASHTHLWHAGTRVPDDGERPLGFVLDEHESLHVVPGPFRDRNVEYPRVASAGGNGWHVIFVTQPAERTSARSQKLAAATEGDSLWYGRYDPDGWHDIRFVSKAAHAIVNSSQSSQLVVGGGMDLFFAYAYEAADGKRWPGHFGQGIVMAHRHDSRWSVDTLVTWQSPGYIQLLGDPRRRSATAFFLQYYHEDRAFHPVSVFRAAFDDGQWQSATKFAGDARHNFAGPLRVVSASDSAFVSWIWPRQVPNDETRLQWTKVQIANSTPPSTLPVVTGAAVSDFDVAGPVGGHIIWLTRDSLTLSGVRAFISTNTGAEELDRIAIPLSNPAPRAIATDDSTIWVVSSKLGTGRSDPVATTFVTKLTLSCKA